LLPVHDIQAASTNTNLKDKYILCNRDRVCKDKFTKLGYDLNCSKIDDVFSALKEVGVNVTERSGKGRNRKCESDQECKVKPGKDKYLYCFKKKNDDGTEKKEGRCKKVRGFCMCGMIGDKLKGKQICCDGLVKAKEIGGKGKVCVPDSKTDPADVFFTPQIEFHPGDTNNPPEIAYYPYDEGTGSLPTTSDEIMSIETEEEQNMCKINVSADLKGLMLENEMSLRVTEYMFHNPVQTDAYSTHNKPSLDSLGQVPSGSNHEKHGLRIIDDSNFYVSETANTMTCEDCDKAVPVWAKKSGYSWDGDVLSSNSTHKNKPTMKKVFGWLRARRKLLKAEFNSENAALQNEMQAYMNASVNVTGSEEAANLSGTNAAEGKEAPDALNRITGKKILGFYNILHKISGDYYKGLADAYESAAVGLARLGYHYYGSNNESIETNFQLQFGYDPGIKQIDYKQKMKLRKSSHRKHFCRKNWHLFNVRAKFNWCRRYRVLFDQGISALGAGAVGSATTAATAMSIPMIATGTLGVTASSLGSIGVAMGLTGVLGVAAPIAAGAVVVAGVNELIKLRFYITDPILPGPYKYWENGVEKIEDGFTFDNLGANDTVVYGADDVKRRRKLSPGNIQLFETALRSKIENYIRSNEDISPFFYDESNEDPLPQDEKYSYENAEGQTVSIEKYGQRNAELNKIMILNMASMGKNIFMTWGLSNGGRFLKRAQHKSIHALHIMWEGTRKLRENAAYFRGLAALLEERKECIANLPGIDPVTDLGGFMKNNYNAATGYIDDGYTGGSVCTSSECADSIKNLNGQKIGNLNVEAFQGGSVKDNSGATQNSGNLGSGGGVAGVKSKGSSARRSRTGKSKITSAIAKTKAGKKYLEARNIMRKLLSPPKGTGKMMSLGTKAKPSTSGSGSSSNMSSKSYSSNRKNNRRGRNRRSGRSGLGSFSGGSGGGFSGGGMNVMPSSPIDGTVTGLSPAEENNLIEETENNPKYSSANASGLFGKISNAYKRSYSRIMDRKHKGGNIKKPAGSVKKSNYQNILDNDDLD
jgi:hypothetical protein